jgi:hypothetical protein
MNVQTELESLQARIAKAPTNVPRILPNTRKMLFAVLGDAGILKGDRADRVQVWRLVTGRQVGSTNDLTDAEAKIFADWLTNPNTGQPRHEAVTAVRAWLTDAGGEGQMELITETEGENMEQQKQTGQVELLEAGHAEAKAIVYTSFVLNGVQYNFTMREGATADETRALLMEMEKVCKWVKKLGAVPVLGRDARANGNGRTSPAPQAPQPAPAKAPSSPPPVGSGGNGDNVETIEFVKITAPKGDPVVEFWRKGRKYPELHWYMGGERLLEIAPTLVAIGWKAEHLDDIGQEYPINLKVTWVQSPKNEKWKDVIAVELVG